MSSTYHTQAAIVVSRDDKVEGLTLLNKALLSGCKVVSVTPFGVGGCSNWNATLVIIEGPIDFIEKMDIQRGVNENS
jgi:hypothetical protein